jgi:aryl-alcohol dehydrogenase-like predicted oxidoreductase
MTAKLRMLGQTDIEISPIGLGVMQFAGGKGAISAAYSEIGSQNVKDIVKTAWEGGINWFDTAEMYGRGRSEGRLANALQENGIDKEDVLIATKWWPMFRTARNIPRSIGKRQRFLSPYPIGLYQVHQPISFSSPEDEMDAMADLVEDGKIRAVGVSNYDAVRMRRAHEALKMRGLALASNQVQYNLIHREIETNGVLETAKELGITIIAWGPLASGLLSGKFHKGPGVLGKRPFYRRGKLKPHMEGSRPLIHALDEIAAAHQVTAAQVALNWLIHYHGDTVVAIPGATKPSHARQNASAMKFILTKDEMIRIDDLTRQFQ